MEQGSKLKPSKLSFKHSRTFMEQLSTKPRLSAIPGQSKEPSGLNLQFSGLGVVSCLAGKAVSGCRAKGCPHPEFQNQSPQSYLEPSQSTQKQARHPQTLEPPRNVHECPEKRGPWNQATQTENMPNNSKLNGHTVQSNIKSNMPFMPSATACKEAVELASATFKTQV